MHCRSCGGQLPGDAAFCPTCGAWPHAGNAFCFNCGSPTNLLAEVCLRCGVRFSRLPPDVSVKSRVVAVLLAYFLGHFGVHRFYTGRTASAIVMLLAGSVVPAAAFVVFIVVLVAGLEPWVWAGIALVFGVYGGFIAVTIWRAIDFVLLAAGKFRDGQGKYIRKD